MGAFIQFPVSLIPAGVAAACGYLFTRGTDRDAAIIQGGAIAYVAGSMGMFIGGDLLHLPDLLATGGSSLVLGTGGILDFVFLTGVVSLFMVWLTLVKKPFGKRCANFLGEQHRLVILDIRGPIKATIKKDHSGMITPLIWVID